ncbi:MAG TPA: xanthine dehydrogenase family protein molybdopterin-binding subunit [Magnetospirillaceae bacterium]
MASSDHPSRRDVLRLGATATGVLALGYFAPMGGQDGAADASEISNFAVKWPPNAFVQIDKDETITITSSKSEMGQGIYTGLAMLLAEELDCDWSKIKVESAPVNEVYTSNAYPVQLTGASTSIRTSFDQYRIIGASARRMLISAAAVQWGITDAQCTTESGFVINSVSKAKLSYGKLTMAAAKLPIPTNVPLKDHADFKLIGTSHDRVDNAEKIKGTAQYAIDIRLPNMVTALVLHPPVYGSRAIRTIPDRARATSGVKAVVSISTGVAVVADGFWHAKLGRDLLKVDWDPGLNADFASDDLAQQFKELSALPGDMALQSGKPAAAMEPAALKITQDYVQPFVAAATMEPAACVVHLKADSCEIWTGTQSQTIDRNMVCDLTGLKPEQVTLHTTYLGGGFGRRAVLKGSDWLREAIEIVKNGKIAVPLKLIWTREDDMTSYYYRPLWVDKVTVGLDREGMPLSWMQTSVGQSIIADTPLEPVLMKNNIDPMSVEGAIDMPYAIPNIQIDLHSPRRNIPVGWFRSIGHSHTAYVKETMIDECAHAAGTDPIAYRRVLLANNRSPRDLAVLDLVAEKSGWDKPMEQGFYRGVALHASFGSYVAIVAEISMLQDRTMKCERVVAAADCGIAVNPDQVIAQIEGGIVFGLNTVVFGEIPIVAGVVKSTNFTPYKLLRMHQAPRIEVYLVPSDEAPGGAGEIATSVIGPAVANAVFEATGERISNLPIIKHKFKYP